ncbi:TRAP transporter small permease [Paracoccus shandongensis]|uniref:TRAP transporter small permease n=1 Tax=Paracoccus shandongensis TaxID=2816048 RepID=UPI001A8E7451|nr:TRAP transporter small permease [Paracoccus shandongensis]
MKLVATLASAIGGVLIAILVGVTALAVFMRYVMGAPFQWTEEISGFLMIWIIMLGAISCEWRRQHLTIDFAVGALPSGPRRAIEIVVGLASAGVLVWMAWLGWQLGQSAAFKRTQILRISWFWLDLAVVVGAGLTALVVLWRLVAPGSAEPVEEETRH